MAKYEGRAVVSIIRHNDGRRAVGVQEIFGGGSPVEVLQNAREIIDTDGEVERIYPVLLPGDVFPERG